MFYIFYIQNISKKLSSYTIKLNKIKQSICLNKKQINSLLNYCILFDILAIVLIYMYYFFFNNYICYFNVGQGNMALIHYKNKNVVIDCGSTDKDTAANVMSNFMKAKTYDNLDAIFITHFHSDHVNGVQKLSEKYSINKLCYIIPKFNNVSEYDKFQNNINQKGISVCELNQYDSVNFSNEFKITVLLPSDNLIINDSDLMNANSSIYLVQIKNKNYIFTGDATKNTEKKLIEILNINTEIAEKFKNIQILQVGHHGSKTSTSLEFLNNIKVKYGIISSKKEKYGHPDQVTLDNLKKYNIKIKITEIDGAIKINI